MCKGVLAGYVVIAGVALLTIGSRREGVLGRIYTGLTDKDARKFSELDFLEEIYYCGVRHFKTGNYSLAFDLFSKALQGHRKLLGDTHPRSISCLHYFAKALMGLGNLKEAKEAMNLCYTVSVRRWGDSNEYATKTLLDLAAIEELMGMNQQSLGRTLSFLNRSLGVIDMERDERLRNFALHRYQAYLLSEQNRTNEALQILTEVVDDQVTERQRRQILRGKSNKEIAQESVTEDDEETFAGEAANLNTLAVLQEKHGDINQAYTSVSRAWDLIKHLPPNPSSLLVQANLGRISYLAGRRTESEKILLDVENKFRAMNESIQYENVKGNRGILLMSYSSMEKRAEGSRLVVSARDTLLQKHRLPKDHSWIRKFTRALQNHTRAS
ncbi:hypothetical protein AAMO2058_001177200 [Amorphochlora amoebiformis]